MKETITKIYHRINNRILDYRYKVNKNAGICFAYYLIMSIIPICSLCAFFARLFNVDLSLLEAILQRFLTPDFSSIVISALSSESISLSSFIVICISIFVVSRGINQLYGISKNLFPAAHERNFIIEQIIMLLKTIAVFILLVIIISILTFLPVISSIFNLSGWLDDVYLFFIFFIILTLLYKIIPDVHIHIFDIIKGAGAAGALLLILLSALELYFKMADYSSVYGPLSSIVVIMISFTLIAEVIYIGMYIMFEAHMKRLIIAMQKKYNLSQSSHN